MAAQQSRRRFRRAAGGPVAEDPPVPEFDFPERDEPAAAASRAADVPPAEVEAEPVDREAAVDRGDGFLSPRPPRRHAESVLVRVVATAGIVGIATAVGAVMGALDVSGWLIGLVVSLLSIVLAALLWRSRIL